MYQLFFKNNKNIADSEIMIKKVSPNQDLLLLGSLILMLKLEKYENWRFEKEIFIFIWFSPFRLKYLWISFKILEAIRFFEKIIGGGLLLDL